MKNRSIGLGLLVLTIGIIWLLFNFNILDWRLFESLWVLWPLVFVAIGINIIFRRDPNVRIGVWLVFLAVVIGYSLFINTDRRSESSGSNTINYNKSEETKKAVLDLDLGGYSFNLNPSDSLLLNAQINGPEIEHSIDHKNGGESAYIRIKDKNTRFYNRYNNNTCDIDLNKDVEWDLDFDVGAFNGNFDFREIKVRKFDVDSGAGNMNLFLGANVSMADIDIDSGASSFNIHVPDEAGVRVKFDGGISKTNLSSLGWEKSGGFYTSPNYSSAESKINIDVDMGIGKLDLTVE